MGFFGGPLASVVRYLIGLKYAAGNTLRYLLKQPLMENTETDLASRLTPAVRKLPGAMAVQKHAAVNKHKETV